VCVHASTYAIVDNVQATHSVVTQLGEFECPAPTRGSCGESCQSVFKLLEFPSAGRIPDSSIPKAIRELSWPDHGHCLIPVQLLSFFFEEPPRGPLTAVCGNFGLPLYDVVACATGAHYVKRGYILLYCFYSRNDASLMADMYDEARIDELEGEFQQVRTLFVTL
jgi:hypothetical protein